jgi:hypothetical protein
MARFGDLSCERQRSDPTASPTRDAATGPLRGAAKNARSWAADARNARAIATRVGSSATDAAAVPISMARAVDAANASSAYVSSHARYGWSSDDSGCSREPTSWYIQKHGSNAAVRTA